MTVLRIHEYPHPMLATVAKKIANEEFGSDGLHAMALDLADTAAVHSALGLAAVQCGIDAALFVMRTETNYVAICNPEIITHDEWSIEREGCLSFRSVHWPMRAPAKIAMRFRSEDGAAHEGSATGLDARCFFHESEHLLGRTMVHPSRMPRMQRDLFLRAVRKVWPASPFAAERRTRT